MFYFLQFFLERMTLLTRVNSSIIEKKFQTKSLTYSSLKQGIYRKFSCPLLERNLRPCLVVFFFITQFPLLNFRHSSLITHHFKYYTRLAPSLNIFHTICGPHTCHSMQLFFFFLVPKLIEPSEDRKSVV